MSYASFIKKKNQNHAKRKDLTSKLTCFTNPELFFFLIKTMILARRKKIYIFVILFCLFEGTFWSMKYCPFKFFSLL